MRAVPYRKDFVESLKKDPSATEEQVVEDTKESIAKMKTNIDEINRYYAEKGLDSSAVVWNFFAQRNDLFNVDFLFTWSFLIIHYY